MSEAKVVTRAAWRCTWRPGKDAATLSAREDGWRLSGRGEMEFPEGLGRLRYRIDCNARWEPRAAEVVLRTPSADRRVVIRVDDGSRWTIRDYVNPDLQGCTDLDLSTTPSTNTLALKRLALPVGGSADILTAWVTFPDIEARAIVQRYTRTSERHYVYEAFHNGFVGEFDVDASGLVTDYPRCFERIRPGRLAARPIARSKRSEA